MKKPTDADIARLPRWAREHIAGLEARACQKEAQRSEAVATMRGALDAQEPTPFSVEDWVCVGAGGPSRVVKFVEARDVTCTHAGLVVTVSLEQDSVAVRFHRRDRLGLALIRPVAANMIEFVRES